MSKNLSELRASNPSPGFEDVDLLLQRVKSSETDVAATAGQLREWLFSGTDSESAVMALQYRAWAPGSYDANKLRFHNGKLALSKENGNENEPGTVTDSHWLIFDKVGDYNDYMLTIASPWP